MCSQDYPNLNEISSSQTKQLVNAYRKLSNETICKCLSLKSKRGKRAANNKLNIEQQNEENRKT